MEESTFKKAKKDEYTNKQKKLISKNINQAWVNKKIGF